MGNLNSVDYTVILIYFGFLVALGLYLKKKASQSLEDYFLGGRKLPWWALGISGMASFLDITGTMIIVSFLYMLGPRGLFIEFRGGAVLVLAIMMLWTGKWHRRSRCITNAEWMIYRFGKGFGGNFARVVGAIGSIISTIGMLAYLVKGVGLFLSMFLPFSPFTCSIIMIGVATIYTLTSGFYGVVYTDIFQSGIILIAVIFITSLAVIKVTSSEQLAALALEVTGQSEWLSSSCSLHTPMPKGYEAYKDLMMVAFFYLLRNIFYGMGNGGEPKYFGARNDRECGKLTFLWTWLMMFRWPMMMAFAILGLFMIKEVFPNQEVVADVVVVIKNQIGQTDKSRWADALASIINTPAQYPERFIAQLQNLLGENWQAKMSLLSYEGTINAERILPAVVLYNIPPGLRGMILVALIAASMSTFDSIVNWTIGFFTRDIYQAYLRKKASNAELIYISWGFGLVLVAISFLFGYTAKSINDIWDWFIMALGGGLLVPFVLRFYWWRFNGGGYAVGTIVGVTGAIMQRIFWPVMNPILQFFVMVMIGLIGSVIGTYLTRPTDRKVLEHFYKTTRPFGLWKPLESILSKNVYKSMKKEHFYDILSTPFALLWQITLFLLPMQLIVRTYKAFFFTLVIFIISLLGLYLFWYTKLPETNSEPDL